MLPLSRGFDTHFGYYLGLQDHLRHRAYGAYDFNDQGRIATEVNGSWTAPLFASKAIDIIQNHANATSPFFLYLAFQDVHWPLQAPQEYIDRFKGQTGGDLKRQMVCAMAAHLDDAVGNVTTALKRSGLWENTLIVFTSDNGGPTNGDEVTASNNFPLRGGKNTLWQGGVRVPAIVRGPGVRSRSEPLEMKMHATDWLPTLVSMAANAQSQDDWMKYMPHSDPPPIYGDGMNLWPLLQGMLSVAYVMSSIACGCNADNECR